MNWKKGLTATLSVAFLAACQMQMPTLTTSQQKAPGHQAQVSKPDGAGASKRFRAPRVASNGGNKYKVQMLWEDHLRFDFVGVIAEKGTPTFLSEADLAYYASIGPGYFFYLYDPPAEGTTCGRRIWYFHRDEPYPQGGNHHLVYIRDEYVCEDASPSPSPTPSESPSATPPATPPPPASETPPATPTPTATPTLPPPPPSTPTPPPPPEEKPIYIEADEYFSPNHSEEFPNGDGQMDTNFVDVHCEGAWKITANGQVIRTGNGSEVFFWNGRLLSGGDVLPDGKYEISLAQISSGRTAEVSVSLDTTPPQFENIEWQADGTDPTGRTFKLSAVIRDDLTVVDPSSISVIVDETFTSTIRQAYNEVDKRLEGTYRVEGDALDIREYTDVIIEANDNVYNAGLDQKDNAILFDSYIAYLPGKLGVAYVPEPAHIRPYSVQNASDAWPPIGGSVGRPEASSGSGNYIGSGSGGIYRLVSSNNSATLYVGRTNNLVRRKLEHARDPQKGKYRFEELARSDDRSTVRGLEKHFYDRLKPPLNKIRPISPKNKNLLKYTRAAKTWLDNTQPRIFRIAS